MAPDFDARSASMETAETGALASIRRMLEAEKASAGTIFYAENWVYAPAVQKEREIIEKTGAQVLWMHGEEAHSGSHAETYGMWRHNGGGALMGKAVHPLSAALYLKRVEGRSTPRQTDPTGDGDGAGAFAHPARQLLRRGPPAGRLP